MITTINPYGYITEIEEILYQDNTTSPSSTASVLRLYDIFIPVFGFFIILLNLAVVVSSGLILKKGN